MKRAHKNFVVCMKKRRREMEGSYEAFKNEREMRERVIIMLKCGHLFVILESSPICFSPEYSMPAWPMYLM